MTKYLFVLLTLIVSQTIQAQETTPDNLLVAGFTFAPSAITTFDKEQPFEVGAALYLGPTYLKGDLGISPFYNFGGNSVGVFLTYQFNTNIGGYLVLDKSINANFGVYGVGLTTPLFDQYVQGFVEFGSSYGDIQQPALITGMYMTFGKTLKEW